MPKTIVVHIAVDTWAGKDLQSSLIGAWTSVDDRFASEHPSDLLEAIRAFLGAEYRPATVEEISAWHQAFTADPSVPWEQISLF
jgi:hypothetical protein